MIDLQLKQAGEEGLAAWDALCDEPQTIATNPPTKVDAFRHLVAAFQMAENQGAPTFSAINAMASFLHRHIVAMLQRLKNDLLLE